MDRETAQAILAAEDRVYAPVTVEEWKDSEGKPRVCRVRSWNAGDLAAFETETGLLAENLPKEDVVRLSTARIVAWSWVDDAGELMCKLPTLQQLKEAAQDGEIARVLEVYDQVANKRALAIKRLYTAALEINALSESVEIQIEKNS